MKQFWVWDAPAKEDQRNLVILFLRIFAGGLMMWHGFTKIADFQQLVLTFPDPFGFGRTLSLLLCIFAEAICAILIFWGLLTRLAAIVLTFNMAVASFITLLEAPLERKELALL